MDFAQRTFTRMQSFLKAYGPSNIKKRLWDKEFSSDKWDFIDDTAGDCVYSHLEKHARNGSILDLGCGPGNTANELAVTAYSTYLGVDISEAALAKAARRTEKNGRGEKNRFEQSDIISYVPKQQFDVILFRESMYHVPLGKVKAVLDRYSGYLTNGGVFVVRLGMGGGQDGQIKKRPKAMIDIMEAEFDVVEKAQYGESKETVIVFRPRRSG
jgi:2-polyprenyl-3-methyl-5-hydroxy-6-metoxy-1,4-benzoquinol methylase